MGRVTVWAEVYPTVTHFSGRSFLGLVPICTKWARRAGMKASGWYAFQMLRTRPRWHAVKVKVLASEASAVDLWTPPGDWGYIPTTIARAAGFTKPGTYYLILRRIPRSKEAT